MKLRERLIFGNTVGEVSLAFGDIDRSESLLLDEVDRINEIISETKYWAHFEHESSKYLVVFDDFPDDNAQRLEFLNRMKTSIKGNPEIFVNMHNGDIQNHDLINFIDNHEIPPENMLDYRPV